MTSIKSHKGLLAFAAMLALGISSTGCLSGADDTSEDPSAAENDALTSNTKTAFQFFVAKGLKKYQAAAIVGNLIQESSVNPSSVQFGGGPGRGIAQWSVGGRWDTDHNDNVHWYAAKEGQSSQSLNLQLAFVWYELETFSGYGLSKLKASSTITQATIAFQADFEGCGQCDQSQRIAYAKQVLAAN
jgi:hypothetical protein